MNIASVTVASDRGGRGERRQDVVKAILVRYYDKAADELRAVGSPYSENLAALKSRADWRAVIVNVIDDLQVSDEGAVARTYLYAELRALVAEKLRRARADVSSSD